MRVITWDLWGGVLEGRTTEAAIVDAMVAAMVPVGALISVESEATSSVEMDDCVPRWHAAGGAENEPMDWIRKSAAKGRIFLREGRFDSSLPRRSGGHRERFHIRGYA